MAERLLTVAEAADLLGIGERGVRKNALAGKYGTVEYIEGSRYGRGGREIRIPLSGLPIAAQSTYMKQHKLIEEPERIVASAYETAPQWARDIANRRYKIMKEYESYIAQPGKKTELTETFVIVWNDANPKEAVSKSTLYNWQRSHKKNGLAGLLPNYGGRKDQRNIDEAAWEFFCGEYLQLTRPTIGFCYRLTELKAKENNWNIPSLKTVARMVKSDIPEELKARLRYGEKYYYDNYQTYTLRDPESVSAGEVFVGDHHVFDLFIYVFQNGKYKWVRPWVTAWMDMRSRKLVSWTVNLSPCTDEIIAAFANAALDPAIGLPREVYLDNGRDYCSHKFGGTGNRGKKLTPEQQAVLIEEGKLTATLMDRLKINTHFAIVENARAKVIEREFRNVVEWFSKTMPTYCGRTQKERPEDLEKKLKQPDKYGMSLEEFRKVFSDWAKNVMNKQVSQGKGRENECPDQTFMRTRLPVRTADPSVMRLFFMRSTNPFKIGRNGITFRGIQYYSTGTALFKRGQSVYVRYQEEDISKIWLYNTKDEFLGEVEKLEAIAGINEEPEVLAAEMERKGSEQKAVKAHPIYQAAKNAVPLTPTDITELYKLYGNSAPDVSPTKVIEMVTLPRAGKDAVRAMQATGTDNINPFEVLARAKIQKRRGDF